jgi:hypothetical protein
MLRRSRYPRNIIILLRYRLCPISYLPAMTDLRHQITIQLDAYTDIDRLKQAVRDWLRQSDEPNIHTLSSILARHTNEGVEYTESDWKYLQESGFTFDSDRDTLVEDAKRLENYRQTHHAIDHERVADWLSSIGTERELPCPN